MAANSVDSDSYVDGSIDAVHLSANSVDSDAYVDGSIDAVHMSANSIDSDAYVDLSIDTAHIGATQVTGAKLNTDVISAQTALAVAPADTDEFMVSDAGVLKRIDYSLIKGGGITEADSWRIAGSYNMATTGAFTDITSDWERTDAHGFAAQLGTGMSESSGIFSFPSTGYWLINWEFLIQADAGDANHSISMYSTINNSSYSPLAQAGTNMLSGEEVNLGQNAIFDVTSTTNNKFKFAYYATATNNLVGHTTTNQCSFTIVRLGDT